MGGALALALGANGYLMVRSNHLNDEIASLRDANTAQFSKLNQTAASVEEEYRDRLEKLSQSVADARTTATSAHAALRRAQADEKKQDDQLAQKIDQQKSEISGALSTFKEDTTSKLSQVSNDVGGVKTDVDGVKTTIAADRVQIDQHAADLKRVLGDMGVMSGLIATNGKDLDSLRALGERNYYEFSLAKGQKSARVGNVMIALKRVDPKHNRYTVEVMADDKLVEKKDRTINEPVQIYVGGSHQPDEIVVNQVKKDVVTGYLSTPKVTVSRR
jgi:chromosome segregation ATPase